MSKNKLIKSVHNSRSGINRAAIKRSSNQINPDIVRQYFLNQKRSYDLYLGYLHNLIVPGLNTAVNTRPYLNGLLGESKSAGADFESELKPDDIRYQIEIGDELYEKASEYLIMEKNTNKQSDLMFALNRYFRDLGRFIHNFEDVGGAEPNLATETYAHLKSLDRLIYVTLLKRTKPDLEKFVQELGAITV